MKALQYHLLYLDDKGTAVHLWRRRRNTHYSTLPCTRSLQYHIQYCSSMRKRKIKDAEKASTDLMSSHLNFWSAQASVETMKTATRTKRWQWFSKYQKLSFAIKTNNLTKPAITVLNAPKIANFWYCTQPYDVSWRRLTRAFAEVYIHSNTKIWSQPKRWKNNKIADLHLDVPKSRINRTAMLYRNLSRRMSWENEEFWGNSKVPWQENT